MNLEDKMYRFLNLYYELPRPVSALLGTVYRQIPRSITMGKHYAEFVELCAQLNEDNDLLDDYVNREFLETIRSAEKTKFYNSLYAAHGIGFSSIKSKADLARLPTINKATLKENFEQLIVPQRKKDGLYLTTGGSSGTPVGFMLEKGVSRAKETAFIEHLWSSVGYRPGDRIAIIRGIALGRGDIVRRGPGRHIFWPT